MTGGKRASASSRMQPLRLLVFPAAEVVCMGLARVSWSFNHWCSLLFILLAACALSYSLHIVFHEVVHRRYFRHPLAMIASESVISVLLGSPFNEYKQSHWRHHRWTNLLEDSTSTWAATPAGPEPRRFWSYSLGWPLLIPKSLKSLIDERRTGRLSNQALARMLSEALLLILLHVWLLYFEPVLWAIYALTIYLGWVGIAAINYLQHPPLEYGTGYTASIYNRAYNRIFYNNGLHFEHHARMQEPVIELTQARATGPLYDVAAYKP